MGHICQKGVLGSIGQLGFFQCLLKKLFLFHLLTDLRINQAETKNYPLVRSLGAHTGDAQLVVGQLFVLQHTEVYIIFIQGRKALLDMGGLHSL